MVGLKNRKMVKLPTGVCNQECSRNTEKCSQNHPIGKQDCTFIRCRKKFASLWLGKF